MFCPNCGQQLLDTAKFCGNCGSKINDVISPSFPKISPLSTESSIRQDAPPNTNAIDTIITKNIEYYSNQFHAIETGNKAKLNWASFFLSYFHAAYRSMWREWLTYTRLPLIATAVSTLLVSWGISSFLSSFNFTVIIIGAIISLISYIFTFTKGILYARDFNKLYKHHVEKKISQNNLTSDISLKNALITLVIALVISGLLTGLISTSLTFSLLGENDSEYSDSSYAYEDSIVYEEPIVKSNDSPIFSFEEESPTATPSTPVNIHDYLGTWAIDSMDSESSFATITLDSRNDYFFLTVDGVFQNGNKMIWIENVELRFDGVQAQGEYYEDGWGNHGFITLKFNDQHIYFSITCEGDGWYGMTASEEHCSRYEQNVSKDLSFDTVNFHDYLGDWVIEDLYTESNFAILTLDTRNDYPYVSVYYSYDNGSEDFGNGVFWIDTVAVSFDGVTAQGDYYLPESDTPGFITLNFSDDQVYCSISCERNAPYGLPISNAVCYAY